MSTAAGLRSLVINEGKTLASYAQDLHAQLTDLRTRVDQATRDATLTADNLLTRIADLNRQISEAEAGAGGASTQRDLGTTLAKIANKSGEPVVRLAIRQAMRISIP